ncbi:MAG TPA: SUMF1/EgtB/PvdO family nonheme iron enzyme [Spirochaetota bacterium]|mgnify:FL=1|nr:SUMF1/EgtB/PvdO family nonheme iron enzyme [Spirochaetota bacterium]
MEDIDFLHVNSDEFVVGISLENVENILAAAKSSRIKREYLEACTPQHRVKLLSFFISKKLVTVKQFEVFIEDTCYVTEAEKEGWGWIWEGGWKKKAGVSWKKPFGDSRDFFYYECKDKFPVIQISWNDASEYAKWLSAKSGIKTELPSEYQWEAFAFSIGLTSMMERTAEPILEVKDSNDFIELLEQRLQNNPYQSGICWEWVYDWYKAYEPSVTNRDFGDVYKVLRGGSILSEGIQRGREFRFRRCPTARSPYYSFRIVQYF